MDGDSGGAPATRVSFAAMDKEGQLREELDEWLAEGKIDRATYDRLSAEQRGEPTEPVTAGLLPGAAGLVMGNAIAYLVLIRGGGEPLPVAYASLMWFLALAVGGIALARGGWTELGRGIAVASSSLWTQAVFLWLVGDFPPDGFYLSTVFFLMALGHFAIGYAAFSALVTFKGALWLVPTLLMYLAEWNSGAFEFGHFMLALAGLGALFLVAAREHLVLRWPSGVFTRFALAYHIAGLSLINWVAYALAWFGWDGEGHANVPVRLACVALTVILYGLEVWAGQNSRMPWVSSMGVIHFLLQVTAILSYPYISLEQRALLVIGLALLLILVTQGESSRRKA